MSRGSLPPKTAARAHVNEKKRDAMIVAGSEIPERDPEREQEKDSLRCGDSEETRRKVRTPRSGASRRRARMAPSPTTPTAGAGEALGKDVHGAPGVSSWLDGGGVRALRARSIAQAAAFRLAAPR